MKILYYSIEHDDLDHGGSVIRKRNLALLQKLAGEEDVYFYVCQNQKTLLSKGIKYLQALTGCEIGIDKELIRKIKEYDYVFMDGTTLADFSIRMLQMGRVISFFHNVEYDYWCQLLASQQNIIKKVERWLYKQAIFVYERRITRYSDTLITLNKRDSDRLKKLYGRESDLLLPTSMEDAYRENTLPAEDKEPYLLFIGSDFFGNTEGLFRFCENCMPKINASLIAAGLNMEKHEERFGSDKIHFYGYVDDLTELYQNAAAVVMPIISGSGMKTKTCEAMMYGKVIFGTQESFEGYLLSEDCILCEDDSAFIDKINAYLESGIRKFSPANRNVYLQNYESNIMAERFVKYFTGERE
ncbi:glycosyltransferase [Butyrivibrio sp. MB2005]|uniref:glycosyltransferase n=1 Tax=Butyrivibrio sp. MB2005 TaxID=1280678 RepID=UPI0004022A58|nr:glycosyltransferase [Butyrivibrio sp. MB2005]